MRKYLGILLKGFACLFLTGWVALCVAALIGVGDFGIPEQFRWLGFLGALLMGIFGFLMIYAYGESVQTLVKMADLQGECKHTLQEMQALLQYTPPPSPFPIEPRRSFGVGDTLSGWRRSPEAYSEAAPANPPRVACSLCGAVQDTGNATCCHCGASFVKTTAV